MPLRWTMNRSAMKRWSPGVIKVRPKPGTTYGIQKEIEIRVPTSGTRIKLIQRITNLGAKPTELAPWSISVMARRGVEVIPLPPKRPHPGSPKNARSAADYAADQVIIPWPYLDFQDPRWHFGSKFITLHQDPNKRPDQARAGAQRPAASATSTGARSSSSGSTSLKARPTPTRA